MQQSSSTLGKFKVIGKLPASLKDNHNLQSAC